MRKLCRILFNSPEDVGVQKYKIDEIAERMKRSDNIDQSSLIEFAKTVGLLLDSDHDAENELNKNLTMVSSRPQAAQFSK